MSNRQGSALTGVSNWAWSWLWEWSFLLIMYANQYKITSGYNHSCSVHCLALWKEQPQLEVTYILWKKSCWENLNYWCDRQSQRIAHVELAQVHKSDDPLSFGESFDKRKLEWRTMIEEGRVDQRAWRDTNYSLFTLSSLCTFFYVSIVYLTFTHVYFDETVNAI